MFWHGKKRGKASETSKLVLFTPSCTQGGIIRGEVHVGQQVERQMRISLCLIFVTMRGREYTKEVLILAEIGGTQGGEVIPFSYGLPAALPISSAQLMYTVQLSGRETEDVHPIEIVPDKRLALVIAAFESLDFRRVPLFGSFMGKAQQFAFVPVGYFMSVFSKAAFCLFLRDKEVSLMLQAIGRNGAELAHIVHLSHWELEDVDILTERIRKELTDMSDEPDKHRGAVQEPDGCAVGSAAAQLFPAGLWSE
ncbi:MAG: hypothetical protein ACE3JP_14910 [Ectobacillus sp.]